MISFKFPISSPATNDAFLNNLGLTVYLDYNDKNTIIKTGNLVSSWINKGSFPANATYLGTNATYNPIDDGTGIKFGTDRTTSLVITGLFNGGTHTDCTIMIVSKPNNVNTAPSFSVLSALGTNFFIEKQANWRFFNTISGTTWDKWTAFNTPRLGNIGKDTSYSKQDFVQGIRFKSGNRTASADYRVLNREEQNMSANGPGIQNLSGNLVIGSQNPDDYKAQETITQYLVFNKYLSHKELISVVKHLELKNKLEIKGSKIYDNCNIQFFGDSLTAGVGTNLGPGACLTYGNQLLEMLGSGITENCAAGGRMISEIATIANSVSIPRYSTSFDKNIGIIMAGTNNLIKTTQTGAQIGAELQNFSQTLRTTGYKISVSTIPAEIL